jgi:hypothetical protein
MAVSLLASMLKKRVIRDLGATFRSISQKNYRIGIAFFNAYDFHLFNFAVSSVITTQLA